MYNFVVNTILAEDLAQDSVGTVGGPAITGCKFRMHIKSLP